MDPVCPTCNQTVKPKAKVRYDTLAEQQAAWLADRLAQHQEATRVIPAAQEAREGG